MFRFHVNPDSEIPIYRQLVDQINARIRSGAIPTGTQLPTVREMAEQMHLSCGTVKRVYDRLQEMGDIEMTRRRGTFVKYVRQDGDSRKLQAMTAIDRMIRQLSDLSFSPAEIEIFLNLKMREWELKWSGVRISVATDAAELSHLIERQLSQMGNVRLSICSLKQLREYPYSIDEQSDVILASVEDAPKVSPILPDAGKLVRVAFTLKPEGAFALAGCAGKKIGVWGEEACAALVAAQLPENMRAGLACCGTAEEAEGTDVLIA
ncbi:MAG: GntR family transcriptional regulator, partial [Clostridia bacterium]|nr:GntR family transcriptional regulator [Clostridia bacterium]